MLDAVTPKENQVWLFDQAQYFQGKGGGRGQCAGMTIYWILLRANGIYFNVVVDNTNRMTIDINSDEIEHIKTFQARIVGHSGMSGYQKIFDDMFDVSKAFTLVPTSQGYNDVELAGIADHVAAKTTNNSSTLVTGGKRKAWFIMRGRPPAGKQGGHAVAIEVSGVFGTTQTFRLMDAMNGCFVFFDLASFRDWLTGKFFPITDFTGYKGCIKIHRLSRPKSNPLNDFAMQASSFLRLK